MRTKGIETEQEEDGRWIAEITDRPGVMAYGQTEDEAKANAFRALQRNIEIGMIEYAVRNHAEKK